MKTLVILHGGGSWADPEAYLDFLRNVCQIEAYEPPDPSVSLLGWKETLRNHAYDQGWTVYSPVFPCKQNAKYPEWKIILDRVVSLIPKDSEIVFVGHSLGGNFAIKYLAETKMDHRHVSSVHLVAACYDEGSFSEPDAAGWLRLSQSAKNIHIWQAKDDTVVPVEFAEYIHGCLPRAEYHRFETGGHFRMGEFPELEREVLGNG